MQSTGPCQWIRSTPTLVQKAALGPLVASGDLAYLSRSLPSSWYIEFAMETSEL